MTAARLRITSTRVQRRGGLVFDRANAQTLGDGRLAIELDAAAVDRLTEADRRDLMVDSAIRIEVKVGDGWADPRFLKSSARNPAVTGKDEVLDLSGSAGSTSPASEGAAVTAAASDVSQADGAPGEGSAGGAPGAVSAAAAAPARAPARARRAASD